MPKVWKYFWAQQRIEWIRSKGLLLLSIFAYLCGTFAGICLTLELVTTQVDLYLKSSGFIRQ